MSRKNKKEKVYNRLDNGSGQRDCRLDRRDHLTADCKSDLTNKGGAEATALPFKKSIAQSSSVNNMIKALAVFFITIGIAKLAIVAAAKWRDRNA